MFKPLTLLLPLLLAPMHAPAAMYKWVDADGNTVYSQTPPPPGIESRQMSPAPPPADPAAQQKLQGLQQQLEDAREDRALAAGKKAEADAEQGKREENCRRARQNLARLQGNPNQMARLPNGEYKRYTAEQREQQMQTQRDVIARDCKTP